MRPAPHKGGAILRTSPSSEVKGRERSTPTVVTLRRKGQRRCKFLPRPQVNEGTERSRSLVWTHGHPDRSSRSLLCILHSRDVWHSSSTKPPLDALAEPYLLSPSAVTCSAHMPRPSHAHPDSLARMMSRGGAPRHRR
ncbi:hypothetical protein AAFF_G00304980 [Aldrovandia affinis]|uniref:Uncharacterized protein n=1 Tax=Aldrovandia affinis TaxID=143900 RepID=A0AAD7SQH7_9TELE|nr:hypothetical protein AAFF_G00304980 [Aldrovandia affinis]